MLKRQKRDEIRAALRMAKAHTAQARHRLLKARAAVEQAKATIQNNAIFTDKR